jgi:hypothetical protein
VFRAGKVTGHCRIVSFTESVKPTLTRSKRGDNIPLVGQVCVDRTGAVWSTRIDFDGRYSARGSVRVTYRPEARVEQVLVPDTMWEWFLLPTENDQGLPLYVEAMATYSNLRQFTVITEAVP